MHKQENDKIEEIIRHAAEPGKYSDNLMELVEKWLLDNELSDDHRRFFKRSFDQTITYGNKPSKTAQAGLANMKRRLGMMPAKVPLHKKTYFRIASAAAAVVIVLGLSFVFLNDRPDTMGEQPGSLVAEMVITADTAVQVTALGDGSEVWLREGSSLREVKGTGNERRVSLTGEAFFEVARDEEKPFIVETDQLEVRVLGTEFDVKAYPEAGTTEVSLFSGSVEVSNKHKSSQLVPGEKLVYRHETAEMIIYELDQQVDWRDDTIKVFDMPLTELFRMIGDYYNMEIVFDGESFPGNDPIELSFGKKYTMENRLDILAKISGAFRYETRDNKVYIYSLSEPGL
jgi:Fe2+-dicitrate sensor, membrane component